MWGTAFALAAIFMIAATFLPARAATLGSTVTNIATVTYGPPSARSVLQTPPADFIVEAARTPSTVDFFRYSPNAPDAIAVQINGSDFAASFDAAGNPIFQPVGPPVTAGGQVLDFSGPVNLTLAENYYPGELILVRVADLGQNGDSAAIETVTATVVSAAGDTITLQLYETGTDTGAFFGYFLSDAGAVTPNDNTVTIGGGSDLTATYQDPFDLTEISTDVAGVDPFGRVFDSATGELLDGVTVTIVEADSGAPAQVFGIDGFSAYPSTVVTGSSVTDASGLLYDLEPGEFRFPIMFPGDYRVVIETPGSYIAPSTASAAAIAALPNGPFTIIDASFLGTFTLDGTGDVSFDIPLDPVSSLVITKEASAQTGAIGDFIRYEIDVENIGDSAATLSVRDEMPSGFRYQAGSARRDGASIADPAIASSGETLTFAGGALLAGDAAQITYVAEITAGAELGEAVNRAFVINGAGAAISNTAEAAVLIEDDLLRSRLTIVGRVTENACNPDDEWPREINDGTGIEGVRLYMETGANVVTDEDGLFHFEDIEARTHVVQIDTATIPDRYEAVQCEQNTRFAGSAISQFVDAQGGSVWRANFYLRNKDQSVDESSDQEAQGEAVFDDATEYKDYDKAWLNRQGPDTAWAYPSAGRTPSTRSVHLGLKHEANLRVKLLLNGAPVPIENFGGREVSLTRTVALTRWRGVDLREGENTLTAVMLDKDGAEVELVDHVITFVSEAARAEFLADQSRLGADGRTPPIIAVRVTDGAGRPVHAGRLLSVIVDPPYRTKGTDRLEDTLPISAPLSAKSTIAVGPDGLAKIELEPTLQTGKLRLELLLDEEQREEIITYLKPELRDWIVVGLAEGAASLERQEDSASGSNPAREFLRDGRVAGFAKGAVKGDWLITIAGDTAKGRGEEDDELFDAIDPDARYSIYGDRSNQEFEAQSRYPVYLKAEKGVFQALFGDYDTGLSESRLGRYTRRLSGFQTIYAGERFSFTGFAAETNQDFARDEIAADGTSGPYQLSTAPLVRNSETLTIESRNRFRPDIIESTTPLTRYLDYDIDFQTGEILLRLPIPAADDDTSFNVIVAEYETSAPVQRNLSTGGRAAFRFLGGRAETGVTIIHEEGRPEAVDGKSDLAAVDFTFDITKATEARLEYGVSRRDSDLGREKGDAILAEINHVSDGLTATAFYHDTEPGYGLNQQNSAVSGVRRFGLEANYRFSRTESKKTGRISERFIDARAYHEENLETGANRTVSEVALRQESASTSGEVGLRYVIENTADAIKRKSLLATTAIRQTFEKLGLTLRASRDQPVFVSDESVLYPKRTTVGFDQQLFDQKVTLSVSHEIQDGDNVASANTLVGVRAEPWAGGNITVSADRITQDSGQRTGATFGVDQQVQLSKEWQGSFGVSRREELDSDGVISEVEDIVPDAAVSPLEDNGAFTSVFIGAGYRSEVTTGSARFEMRKSEEGRRYAGVLGAAREVSEAFSLAGAARVQFDDNDREPNRQSVDARLGIAWRPRGEGLIAFNRFDIKRDEIQGELNSWKAVNNLALNAMLDERWQISLNHGFKYAVIDDAGVSYSGITQLFGAETRFDITEAIDIGLRGSALYSHNAGTINYSFGPSVGVTPADNIWLSFGWNFAGFVDEDFVGAEYTREGPFLQLRVKFDQHTARGLLNAISPDRTEHVAP